MNCIQCHKNPIQPTPVKVLDPNGNEMIIGYTNTCSEDCQNKFEEEAKIALDKYAKGMAELFFR